MARLQSLFAPFIRRHTEALECLQALSEVKRPSSIDRLLIVFHSPLCD
jgi:hypothetical protein